MWGPFKFVRLCLVTAWQGSIASTNANLSTLIGSPVLAILLLVVVGDPPSMTRADIIPWLLYVAASLALGWGVVLSARLMCSPYRVYQRLAKDNDDLKERLAGYERRPALQFIFDPPDEPDVDGLKYIPPDKRDHIHYYIGIKNASPDKTIENVRVVSEYSRFLSVVSDLNQNYPTSDIYAGRFQWTGNLDPLEIKRIYITSFHPDAVKKAPALGGCYTFKVSASGKDCPVVSADFEWNPNGWPALRLVGKG